MRSEVVFVFTLGDAIACVMVLVIALAFGVAWVIEKIQGRR